MQRRNFLQHGLGSAISLAMLQRTAFAATSEKPLRVALIGCGWYGKTDLLHLLQVAPAEVVGLCDVDRQTLSQAAELVASRQPSGATPPTFTDFRRLLQEQGPEIVIVGTPDHWHCLPMVEACRAGADVYVQKPISYDVVEGQAMVAAAEKYERTVQVGLQRRSTPHLLEARERFIDSGEMGKIAAAEIHSYFGGPSDFPPDSKPPGHLDWETYVGPAPWREYNPGIHPRRWRACREFSNGQMGDLCVHFFDLVRFFLKLGWPRQLSAEGGILMRSDDSRINTADTQTALFDFDDVQVVWNQRNWGRNPQPKFPWGASLFGEKGTLNLSVHSWEFLPADGGSPIQGNHLDERGEYPQDLEHSEVELFAAPATRRHMQDFLRARRERVRPVSDIREGYISTACCILANLSMELDRSLRWDNVAEKVIDDEQANHRLQRPYRGTWTHPTPENV
jgi:predicted dehydrogenase